MRRFITGFMAFFLAQPLCAQEALPTADAIFSSADQLLTGYTRELAAQSRQVSYHITPLDPRLQLAACEAPLQSRFISEPMAAQRATILVECEGQRPWRLYLNADIEISAKAWVAARPLNRGQRFTADTVRQEDVIINRLRKAPFFELKDLLGLSLLRPIAEGTVISADLVRVPDTISKGDAVVITARSAVMSVVSRGTAIDDGQLGEQIPVRNDRSQKTIRAIITGPGQVEIPM